MEVHCEFELALKDCGCIIGDYYIPDDTFPTNELNNRIDCAMNVCSSILSDENICNSVWPCKENVYDPLVSHSSWPDILSTKSVIEDLVLYPSFQISKKCACMLGLIYEIDYNFSRHCNNFTSTQSKDDTTLLSEEKTMCVPYMGLLEALDIPFDEALNKTS